MNTGQKVIAILESQYHGRGGRENLWRCRSPFRKDSDSPSFVVYVDPATGEHGWWKDFVSGDSGSLYQLAEYLQIEVPRQEATNTKRVYADLAEYAQAHGVPASAFEEAKWHEGERKGRKALLYPTQTGEIARFLDGGKPTYDSPDNYQACWYGLTRAVTLAQEQKVPLVLCNGAASVIAAQYHGIPAACRTGGELKLTDLMLEQLEDVWTGDVIIAPDCDATGDRWRKEMQEQFGIKARVVDLALSEHGDLADFCRLHADKALKELQARAYAIPANDEDDPALTYVTSDQAWTAVISSLTDPAPLVSIENPFKILHAFGGIAHIISQNEIMGIVAPSGGGKTIWMETGVYNMMRAGLNAIFISNEWIDPEGLKFGYRQVQRMGGPTYEMFEDHNMALKWKALDRPPNGHHELTANQQQLTHQVITRLRMLPGRAYYGTVPGMSAETTVRAIRKYHRQAVEDGREVSAVFLDYAQQFWLEHQERSSRIPLDVVLEIIREECNRLKLAIFVAAQMRKDDAEAARLGGPFQLSSMQWMSEQPFQLLMFSVPSYLDAHTPERGKDGRALLRAQILKNSTGQMSEVFKVPWEPARLWIYDTPLEQEKVIPYRNMSLKEIK